MSIYLDFFTSEETPSSLTLNGPHLVPGPWPMAWPSLVHVHAYGAYRVSHVHGVLCARR